MHTSGSSNDRKRSAQSPLPAWSELEEWVAGRLRVVSSNIYIVYTRSEERMTAVYDIKLANTKLPGAKISPVTVCHDVRLKTTCRRAHSPSASLSPSPSIVLLASSLGVSRSQLWLSDGRIIATLHKSSTTSHQRRTSMSLFPALCKSSDECNSVPDVRSRRRGDAAQSDFNVFSNAASLFKQCRSTSFRVGSEGPGNWDSLSRTRETRCSMSRFSPERDLELGFA